MGNFPMFFEFSLHLLRPEQISRAHSDSCLPLADVIRMVKKKRILNPMMNWENHKKLYPVPKTLYNYVIVFLFLIFFSAPCFVTRLHAQQHPDKKTLKLFGEAEIAYQQNHFSQAELYLAKVLKRDAGFVKAYLLQGDVYASRHQMDSAVLSYRRGLHIDSVSWPVAFFILAGWEYNAGDYLASGRDAQYFLRFENKNSNRYQQALLLLRKATFAAFAVAHPVKTRIKKLNSDINSSENEYINFVNENQSRLIFTRKILESGPGKPVYKEHFFRAYRRDNVWEPPTRMRFSWDSTRSMGALGFSVDGRNMYFTGCYWPGGFGSCDIYVSRKKGIQWQFPGHLDGNVNTSGWDSQAVISSDGKRLFFASKRPGGFGGSDIWMCIRQKNGRWGRAMNLGDSINTPGNEMAPFLHADNHTLYFSSNGRTGMGGYDLYVSCEDSAGHWSKATNLGFPVNTKANEINIFVSLNGQHAWLSSDRDTAKTGFDIYAFPVFPKICPGKVLFVKGTVQDARNGKKLAAVVLLTNLSNGRTVDSVISDAVTGHFLMVLRVGTNYAFNIQKRGYLIYSQNLNLKEFPNIASENKTFALMPISRNARMPLHNIRFDFDRATLKPSALPELKKLVGFLKENPAIKVLIAGYTDNVGSDSYNLKLSQRRAKAVYSYLISKGIPARRLQYKGFGNTHPLSANNSPLGRAANRRTEIVIK